jgi:hypothetical protein
MGYSKIKGELSSRIGRSVRFGAPKGIAGGAGYETIVDEVWADPDINASPPRPPEEEGDWGDYSFCSQLIKWNHGGYSIRLAYYRRRCGEDWWEFASQTTVNSDWKTIKALFERTLEKEAWFRDNPET